MNIMKTIVRNVITGEEACYVNSYSVIDNLVTEIMLLKKICAIWDEELREKIRKEYNIKETQSLKKDRIYSSCIEFNLYAYTEV